MTNRGIRPWLRRVLTGLAITVTIVSGAFFGASPASARAEAGPSCVNWTSGNTFYAHCTGDGYEYLYWANYRTGNSGIYWM